MRLVDLHPAWEKHGEYIHLAFDCPKCLNKDIDARLSIPTPPHPKAWDFSGTTTIDDLHPGLTEKDFETLTVSPSIDFKHGDWNAEDPAAVKCHAHFYIRNGAIDML